MKALVLLALIAIILLLQFAEGRYRFEVRLSRYRNPNHQDYDGGCCDPSISCSNPCDILFFFCLRNYQHSPSLSDSPCDYGRIFINDGIAYSESSSIGSRIGSQANPLVYTGSTWPGRFQLMIRLRDADSPDSDDLVDRIVVNKQLNPSSSFDSTRGYLGNYGKVTLDMSFRVRCDSNYYGNDCATYCVAQDSDTNGHYTCGSSGNRVCNSGYTGDDCLTPVCQVGCDSERGTCSRPGQCDICFTGWSGPLCANCELAAGCSPDRAYCREPGQCICNFGYSGDVCQHDDDVCGHQSPCRNGGTCTNAGSDAYTCTCPEVYTGQNCSEEVDYCDSSPCQNGATCEPVLGNFTCTCSTGWTGPTCGENINECSVNQPCQNGGNCTDCIPGGVVVIDPDSPVVAAVGNICPNGFTCACPEGWFGDTCEVDVDYCLSSPCRNNGTCHDIVGEVGYRCDCPTGFTGVNCEAETDECEGEPCMNGATCLDLFNAFSCECAAGYTGSRCEVDIDECEDAPCSNLTSRGCLDRVAAYQCDCLSGYTGTNCETEVNECDSSPCLNGAVCMDLFNDFTCECAVGFTGVTCSVNIDDCHPHLCLSGGTCVDKVNDYTCECTKDRTGKQCETEVDPCDPSPCKEDFVCIRTDSPGGYDCTACVETEAGCKSAEEQGGSADSGIIAGAVIGGLVAALLFLGILIACCCWRHQCCCCCCYGDDKEEEIEIESQDHAQNNPLYFGVSTILSSGSLRPKPRPKTHPDHVYTDLTTMSSIDDGNTSAKYGTLTSPTSFHDSAPSPPGEPHYEHIPAQLQNGVSSGDDHYQLLEKNLPFPSPPVSPTRKKISPKKSPNKETLQSGKYDKLEDKGSGKQILQSGQYDSLEDKGHGKENPYVASPTRRGNRDMYTLLPSSEELKKMADSYEGSDA